MSSSAAKPALALATGIEISDTLLTFTLSDGRSVSAPLAWYPRLSHGTPGERSNWRLIGRGSGVHWPDLDEDISVQNLLEGNASGESQESLRKWLEGRGEGIGPKYAAKLATVGIKTTEALLKKGSTLEGRKEIAKNCGISDKILLRCVNMADLFRIKGVGEEYADLLEAAGVDTVPELAQRNAANLHAKMVEVNEKKKLVRRPPAQSMVEDWVAQAKKLPRVIEY